MPLERFQMVLSFGNQFIINIPASPGHRPDSLFARAFEAQRTSPAAIALPGDLAIALHCHTSRAVQFILYKHLRAWARQSEVDDVSPAGSEECRSITVTGIKRFRAEIGR
jgi:hypothetical protein